MIWCEIDQIVGYVQTTEHKLQSCSKLDTESSLLADWHLTPHKT